MFTRTTNSLKVSGLHRKKETQANLKIWFWGKQQNQVNGQSLGHWNDPVIVVLWGSSSLITLTKGQNVLPLRSSISLLLCQETFGAYFECWILHISICYGLNCALPTHPKKIHVKLQITSNLLHDLFGKHTEKYYFRWGHTGVRWPPSHQYNVALV